MGGLLALLQERFAPLVVDRRNREDYIGSLDAANDGDLRPLVRLFGRLEIVALRTELERPAVISPASNSAIDIAKAHADRLVVVSTDSAIADQAATLSAELRERVNRHVRLAFNDLSEAFRRIDPTSATNTAMFNGPSGRGGEQWVLTTKLTVLEHALSYSAHLTRTDRQTGVLTLSVSAGLTQTGTLDIRDVLHSTPLDAVTFVPDDAVEARWPEVEELIDRTLAVAVDRFGRSLG